MKSTMLMFAILFLILVLFMVTFVLFVEVCSAKMEAMRKRIEVLEWERKKSRR